MLDKNKASESDAYDLIKSFENYLKTEIEVTQGTIERQVRRGYNRETIQEEGYTVKVTVSNKAPTEPSWPLVVFTGVGLTYNRRKYGNNTIMKRATNLKVDLSEAPQGGSWNMLKSPIDIEKTDGIAFPPVTQDEKRHGYFLFPGQFIIYEMSLSSKSFDNIGDLDLGIEGTLSRRHLFHYKKELKL